MIRTKQWCIHERPEGGYLSIQVLGTTKNSVSFSAVKELQTLDENYSGTLHYTFTPEQYYLYTDTFPQLKPELLALQVKKRFTDLGVAMDAGRMIHKSRELSGRTGAISSVFVHEEDLGHSLPQISAMKGLRKCRLLPAGVCIAGLLRQVTEKAVLIFLIGRRFSHVLVVKGGIPLYNQSLAQTGPGQVEEALIPNAVEFARVTLQKDHEIEDFNVCCLGPGRDAINLEKLGIKEWHPDFRGAITAPQPEEILRYPHLFGVYFADPAYNFIPKEFVSAWRIQTASKITAVGAAVASLILLAAWFYYQPIIKEKRSTYQSISTELDEQRERIAGKMPQNTILNNFQRLVNIRTTSKKDVRLDVMAKHLSDALPPNVHITELKIQRQTTQEDSSIDMPPETLDPAVMDVTDTDQELSLPERIQARPVAITLTGSSEGSYLEVTTRFEKAASALNKVFGVENLTWSYREVDSSGAIHCTLFPRPGGQNDAL